MIVRFYAAAAEAAGREQTTSEATTLAALRAELVAAHPAKLAEVLPQCSYFVDGARVAADADAALTGVATVDVLPPFAGG